MTYVPPLPPWTSETDTFNIFPDNIRDENQVNVNFVITFNLTFDLYEVDYINEYIKINMLFLHCICYRIEGFISWPIVLQIQQLYLILKYWDIYQFSDNIRSDNYFLGFYNRDQEVYNDNESYRGDF